MLIYSHVPLHASPVSVPLWLLSSPESPWRTTQWPAQLAKEKLGLAFMPTHHQNFSLSPSLIPHALNDRLESSKDSLI